MWKLIMTINAVLSVIVEYMYGKRGKLLKICPSNIF